jgi:hypothetical protein
LRWFLTYHKNSQHGANGFNSPPKEGALRIFIALKKSIASAWYEPANLGSNGKYANHYTTEETKQ